MFDIFRSRDKAVRTIITAMLGLVALSMVAYLVPGGIGSGGSNSPETVADVCGQKISTREVQIQLQSALKNKQFPIETIQNYIPQFVNQFVSERAVACQAADMGLTVSEEDVAKAIRSMLPQIFAGGFNKEVYVGFLRQQNLEVGEFEANVRKQMQMLRLQNMVLEGMIVTPDEVENEFRRRNEKIKIDYVAFNADKFRSQVTLTPADVQTYFNNNRAAFRIPEKRSFDMIVASEERIGAQLNLPDEILRQAYAGNVEKYRSGERVNVRHILVMTTNKSADDVKKLEAKANDLLKQVKSGGDFAKLARENSDDPGSKEKGGDLGWVVKGQTVANFEAAAFSTKKGDITNVIKTEYGFHILQVMDREDARVKPFEEVKGELAAEVRKGQVQSRMESLIEQARAELAKNPNGAGAIAQKLGLTYYNVQNAGPGDPLQEIGIVQEFEGAIFSLAKGGVTNSIVAPGNKLVVGSLLGITPARQAELNEVEAQVRAQVTEQKAREIMVQKQKEVDALTKQSNGDLKAIAKAVGAEVRTTPEFTRDGAAEGVGSGTYFADLFTKEAGATVGPINIQGQIVIAKLNTKIQADLAQLANDRDTMITALKSRKSQERKDLFEDGLVNRLIAKGKIKINQDAIKRLVTSYRG